MRIWTKTDDTTLITMTRRGHAYSTVAMRLGRTAAAVQMRASTMRARGVFVPFSHALLTPAPVVTAPSMADRNAAILAAAMTSTPLEVSVRFGLHYRTVVKLVTCARKAGADIPKTPRTPAADRRTWTPADEAELIMLRNAGVTDEELAVRTGRSIVSLWTRMSRLRSRGVEIVNVKHWPDDHVDALVAMYEAGSTVAKISAALGRSRASVEQRIEWLREDGTLDPYVSPVRKRPTHDPLLAALVAAHGRQEHRA